MMAGKLHWFPLYVKDLMMSRKVAYMTNAEFGIYIKLLCLQWLDGPLPKNMKTLSKISGIIEGEVVEAWKIVSDCFTETPEGYVNEFLEEVREEQEMRARNASLAGKAGAEARWGKRINGNRSATAVPTQCDGNGIIAEKNREEQNISEKIISESDPIGLLEKSFKGVGGQSDEFKHWCYALEKKTGNKQGWNKKYKARWEHALKHLGLPRMLEIIEPLSFTNVEYLLTGSTGDGRGILTEAVTAEIQKQNTER